MAVVIQKPPLWRRVWPVFEGFDWPLLGVVLVLACTGLLVMYSVSFNFEGYFETHARNLMIAAAVMFLVSQISTQKLMALAIPLYVVGVLLLVAVELFGVTRNGAQRWLDLGVVMQPSEIMKISIPLVLAAIFHKREGRLRVSDYLMAAGLLLIPSVLIVSQPDLDAALLVIVFGLFVIFFAGLSWMIIIPPLLIGVAGVIVLMVMGPQWCEPGVDWQILHEYQRQRVCVLLDPMRDPLGRGFHTLQGMIAIGAGGLWGSGFLQGTQTHLNFLPERTTDFVFAAFAEEFGFIGIIALIAAFIFLFVRCLKIAVEAPTMFSRLLAATLTMIIFVYVFINMGMVSGMLPVVGVPLPFMSYGGTAMVTLGAMLGMLLSIARSTHQLRM